MFNFDVFVELSFILLIIFHTHGQKFLKDDDICGLTKKQIQEALSHSLKYSVNGIAINSDCLEGQNINNDQCLKEQSKLIECLQREYVLTKELKNEEMRINSPRDSKEKNQETKINNLQNIVEENEELDNIAKDYEETVIQHLQALDYLIKKKICVDNLSSALADTKIELTAIIRQQIFDSNIDKIAELGVYCAQCFQAINSTQELYTNK